MNIIEFFQRFQLNYDFIIADEIRNICASKSYSFIAGMEFHFAYKRNILFAKFYG